MSTTKIMQEKFIPLPITQVALQMAQQFAEQQPTQERKKQVYLNTLAVCVVKDYLEIMDIPTDLKASDSWNPAMRLYTDVADLKLTQLGYLECRPVRSGTLYYIPQDVPDDRIGVVVVEIDEERQEATLLGFAETVGSGELSLDRLQEIDNLLEHLDCLERQQAEVNLSQWLHHIFEAGWQSVEEILYPKSPLLAFRKSSVTRGKVVDLGIHLPHQLVMLVVTLTPKTSVEIQIKMQVYPTKEQVHLPENLAVKVLDGEGTSVMEARAQTANTNITLELSAQRGERFSILLNLGNTNITEHFIV